MMSVTYEGGHAKNIANFEVLISCIEKHGTTYNPTNPSLQPDQLRRAWKEAVAANEALNVAISANKSTVNARSHAFQRLPLLVSRINRLALVVGFNEKDQTSVRYSVRKLQGVRAQPRLTEKDIAQLVAEGKEVPTNKSSSQMSHDNRINHLEQLIKLLEVNPGYAPNEDSLKIDALNDYLVELRTHNTLVIQSRINLNHARMERNRLMYSPTEGLSALTRGIKNYVYAVFGVQSMQAREVSILRFRWQKYTSPANAEARTSDAAETTETVVIP